jgi:NIPSNAP
MGPYFEMRTYNFPAGDLPKIMKVWEKAVPPRAQLSPLCALWYSELGGLNKFVHIWPYPTLNARNEIREKAVAAGIWPPSGKKFNLPDYEVTVQENKIVMPSAFSPLQ